MRCAYDMLSVEAYAGPSLDTLKPADVHLCTWPDMNPERLVDAPRWLQRLIGGGLAITPGHDCVGCAAYRAELPKEQG